VLPDISGISLASQGEPAKYWNPHRKGQVLFLELQVITPKEKALPFRQGF